MHRKSLLTAACALAAALVVGVTGPGQAQPTTHPDNAAHQDRAAAGGLNCPGGVFGVTSDRKVVMHSIKNGKVTEVTKYGEIGYGATAIGFFDSTSSKRRTTYRYNTVTTNGTPRQLRLTYRKGHAKPDVSSVSYDQDGFEPRLYADSYTYFAYTVNDSGVLHRWSLWRLRNGDIKYAKKVVVARGFADLTSLQAGYSFKKRGAWSEYLYATTDEGALKQIVVPHKKPGREKVRTLKSSGYDAVTELSWAYCNGDPTHTLLFAVDPVADTATWTTIKNNTTRPRTTLRGEIRDGGNNVSWDFSAAM